MKIAYILITGHANH